VLLLCHFPADAAPLSSSSTSSQTLLHLSAYNRDQYQRLAPSCLRWPAPSNAIARDRRSDGGGCGLGGSNVLLQFAGGLLSYCR
jgi:hypothetical protein